MCSLQKAHGYGGRLSAVYPARCCLEKTGLEKETKYTLAVGAGSGIFDAYRKLAPEKHYILMDLPEKIAMLKKHIGDPEHRLQYLELDVRDIKEIRRAFSEIGDRPIGELMYLAGINYFADALDVTEEIWDDILRINLKGCFFVMQETARNMIRHGISGSMVNISSQHGIVGNTRRAPYCASKAGLLNMNRVLALEWAAFGIRINAVAPTFILYPCNEELLMEKNFKKKNLREIPLNRYCTAEDIAGAVDFLLSDKSRMMTGQSMILDGGWTIK